MNKLIHGDCTRIPIAVPGRNAAYGGIFRRLMRNIPSADSRDHQPKTYTLEGGTGQKVGVSSAFSVLHPEKRCGTPRTGTMFGLQPENIYMADPYVIWEKQLKDSMLGPEACLWTERVPEWRVMQKILPRIGAYSEVARSRPENKDWYDFSRRSDRLRTAGYEDWLRSFRD